MACAPLTNQQVLSKSVGETFAYYGDDDTAETEKYPTIFWHNKYEIPGGRLLQFNRELGPFREANEPESTRC